jgi:hypothetical protein
MMTCRGARLTQLVGRAALGTAYALNGGSTDDRLPVDSLCSSSSRAVPSGGGPLGVSPPSAVSGRMVRPSLTAFVVTSGPTDVQCPWQMRARNTTAARNPLTCQAAIAAVPPRQRMVVLHFVGR